MGSPSLSAKQPRSRAALQRPPLQWCPRILIFNSTGVVYFAVTLGLAAVRRRRVLLVVLGLGLGGLDVLGRRQEGLARADALEEGARALDALGALLSLAELYEARALLVCMRGGLRAARSPLLAPPAFPSLYYTMCVSARHPLAFPNFSVWYDMPGMSCPALSTILPGAAKSHPTAAHAHMACETGSLCFTTKSATE